MNDEKEAPGKELLQNYLWQQEQHIQSPCGGNKVDISKVQSED